MTSKNYPKSKTLKELEKLDIDWLECCYEAKCTLAEEHIKWAEEHIKMNIYLFN